MGRPLTLPPAGESGGTFLWLARIILAVNILVTYWLVIQSNPVPSITVTYPTTTKVLNMKLTPTSLGSMTIGLSWPDALATGAVPVEEIPCQLARYHDAFIHGINDKIVSITINMDGAESSDGTKVGGPASSIPQDTRFSYGFQDGTITYIRAGNPNPIC